MNAQYSPPKEIAQCAICNKSIMTDECRTWHFDADQDAYALAHDDCSRELNLIMDDWLDNE